MRLTVFDIVDKGVPTSFSFFFSRSISIPFHFTALHLGDFPCPSTPNNKNSKSVLSSFTYSLTLRWPTAHHSHSVCQKENFILFSFPLLSRYSTITFAFAHAKQIAANICIKCRVCSTSQHKKKEYAQKQRKA